MEVEVSAVPIGVARGGLNNETLLFSESAGRFIVTLAPENKTVFEKLFKGLPASCIGRVTDQHDHLKITGLEKTSIIDLSITELETAFQKTFGDMI
jgi:phosphoribosylformylglycinamidine synthase